MTNITIILIAIAGIIFGYYLAKRTYSKKLDVGRSTLMGISKINAKKRENKEEGKQRILEYMKHPSNSSSPRGSRLSRAGQVKNDDVENLLGVSDATATRYLDELEAENKITAQGVGRGTYYTLK